MVTICQMSQVNYAQYDEVWAIVRSLKYGNPRLRHVPDLSPSWSLFKTYLQLRDEGRWDEDTFRTIYVPQFLKEMHGKRQQELLNELFFSKKHICLACFCPQEELCHRSIVGGMLQGAGVEVKGLGRDYSYYFDWYKKGVPGVSDSTGPATSTGKLEKYESKITYLYAVPDGEVFDDGLLTMFFTGRRPKDLCMYDASKYTAFVASLAQLLYAEFYQKLGIRRYISGLAQGFDQMAFWAVEMLKVKYGCTDIQNVVFMPFEGQELRWKTEGCFSQDEYWKVIGRADRVIVVSSSNSVKSMFDRNHAMCDFSDYGLGLYPDDSWRTSKGGTSECLRYAADSNVGMFRLGYAIDKDGLHMGEMAAL